MPGPTTIHGREDERAILEAAVAPGAPGSALALVGEAGIGKTRLARHAAETAAEAGRAVVEGHTLLGLAEPLGVVCDAVRAARRAGLDPGRARDPLASGFPALVLAELGAGGIETGNLGATFEAAARYLRALAARRGLLVVLEDLHWADATSLSLVPFLARALARDPVAMLLTYRPDDETRSPALVTLRAELRRGRLADELPIGPLTGDEAAAMLAEVLGGRPAPEVQAELLRLSGGNPFALEELARATVESGWIDAASGRRRGTQPVSLPWTLAESIRARASRLDPAEREVISWAAAIGERFDLRLLVAAAGLSTDQALESLARLADAGLIVEDPADSEGDAFAFRHALVHEALARERLSAQRRNHHRRILDAGEELARAGRLEVSEAELARHALAAGDRERALGHSRAAADRAQEVGAVEEAVAHLERALGLWTAEDGPALRAELLLACGRLRARGQRDARAAEILSQAVAANRDLADDARAALALSALGEVLCWTGDVAGGFDAWGSALPELRRSGRAGDLAQALAPYAKWLALEDRVDDARCAAEEGLRCMPENPAADAIAARINLMTTLGQIALWNGEKEEGDRRLSEAARLAAASNDDLAVAYANYLLGAANHLLRTPAELIEYVGRAVELVARHGLRALQAHYLSSASWAASRAADWDGAGRLIADAEALLEPEASAEMTRWQLDDSRACILMGSGDLDAAEAVYTSLLERGIDARKAWFEEFATLSLATLRLLADDPVGARETVGRAADRYRRLAGAGEGAPETARAKVAVFAVSGETAAATEISRWFAGVLPGHPEVRCSDALVAMSGDPAGAAALLEGAASELESRGWRLDAAEARMVGATIACRVPGGREPAATLLRSAHARYRDMGSEAWCRRIEERLRRMGARAPSRATRRGAGGLTAREREVLSLVAEGLTNRAIAERLVLSENTVIRHVANIFAKLGVGNRAAAVAAAGRALDPPETRAETEARREEGNLSP